MKKWLKRILKGMGMALLMLALCLLGWRLLWGRQLLPATVALQERTDVSWAQAMADGVITHDEVALHYAPEIDAAVNVFLSGGGRGDFITSVDYDGDWITLNNWENLNDHPLKAVVYYSVQETDTHWYAGYYFYHPRDDAEIWLDRHENDMEGIMLCIPKAEDGFLPPVYMYTQGHGLVPFYIHAKALGAQCPASLVAEGNRYGGKMLLEGHRVVLYITPNGTLNNAGHSVESAKDHSLYWSVGNSGVRYYSGGMAQEPVYWNGAYTLAANQCSYELRSLDEIWQKRNGPYGNAAIFGQYGAFRGDNWGTDKANPPWGWRNKTIFGFGGAFLSDPVWTLSHAIPSADLSANYIHNAYAPWRITFNKVRVPSTQDVSACTLHLFCNGWEFSNPAWFTLQTGDDGWYAVTLSGERSTLYVAAPRSASWRMEVRDGQGRVIPGAAVAFTAEYVQP